MGQQPLKDCFAPRLAKQVMATQITSTLTQSLYPKRREVNIVSEEEDNPKPALLASKKVSD
jgi:hypothetical protein